MNEQVIGKLSSNTSLTGQDRKESPMEVSPSDTTSYQPFYEDMYSKQNDLIIYCDEKFTESFKVGDKIELTDGW